MNDTSSKRRDLLSSGLPIKIGAALAVALCLLIAWSIYLVRDKLLMNADDMGSSLAASYAAEEENRTSVYSLLMSMVASSLNHALDNDEGAQAYASLLKRYDTNIEDSLGVNIIDPYAVIDGRIIAANPWQGDESYDYASAPWYTAALEADGHVAFTDAYTDAVTGKELVTMSVKLSGEGNVLAFDIFLENFHVHRNKASLPQGSSYYLFDESGALIYTTSDDGVEDEQTAAWANDLRTAVLDGQMEDHLASITDLDGVVNGVYYSQMSNGWLSVITIPIKDILQDGWDAAIVALAAICLVLVLLVIAIMIRGHLDSRRMKHTEDTLKILGDTFYAIYRIDYNAGTYETIKSSPDVREGLGHSGAYSHMLSMVGDVVEKRTFDAFEQSFSLENIRKLAAEGVEEFGGDYRRHFPDGYKWVNIRLIYNRDLGLNEVVMCFREVDAEKRQQLQQQALLESALDSARQTVDKKSAFFSNVSHDMRTPLNAVIGLSSLARANLDDRAKTEDYLDKIEQAGSQLLTLVNDVLDMSRIEHGKETELAYVPTDLAQCVKDGASLFKEAAERSGKTLHVQVDESMPFVMCDPARIGQILNNLISNAVKYSLPGGTIDVTLDVASRRPKMCKCRIIVSDTGIGMSQDFLERIFEPFARETTFSPSKVSGTGLGMPIVKSLVQQMSGEISVNSELGKGSTFTVVLPLRIAEEEELAGAQADAPSNAAPDFSLEGKRLLIAEDNEINMEIMQEMMDAMGAEVIPAMNGREAVSAFEATDPGYIDVILMDMQMPEMDGCEACRAIRALERSDAKTVPVIAVTANAFAEDIARTTEAGMNAHVSKPIDFNALIAVLAKVCGK
ncbi:ATP-binding protein [uncultured Slackia sp.]|uniref:hybrid sensor histidine kinase/response regulator n=1 Tax=uncultured Slackia sp. TaxID=665903 RepID=UPI0025CCA46D|nr:ATP-binding protein [uncultured Slackia sp.]